MSTQADIISAYEAASKMRWFPWGHRAHLRVFLAAFALPVVPRLVLD
ncbi:MAG: hypothetical protein IRZ16_05000 [Myxococcaceae bacterium]|nr:hypothetical protein [Myxococcaceae bacterium]